MSQQRGNVMVAKAHVIGCRVGDGEVGYHRETTFGTAISVCAIVARQGTRTAIAVI